MVQSIAALISSIDSVLLVGVLIALVTSVLVSSIPLLQRNVCFLALSVVGAVVFYGRAVLGVAIVIAAAYVLVCRIGRAPMARRWHLACLGLLALVVVFVIGRVAHWDRLMVIRSTPLAFYSLDMWLALRLVT